MTPAFEAQARAYGQAMQLPVSRQPFDVDPGLDVGYFEMVESGDLRCKSGDANQKRRWANCGQFS